jgi:hypothetical protein
MKVKGKFSDRMEAIAVVVSLLEMSNSQSADATPIILR